jgi:hypothetical protein
MAICDISFVGVAVTGDLTAVLDAGGHGHSTRVIVYQIVIYSSAILAIAMISIGLIFCFSKIVKLVWTTSSKISKLLRTDDRPLVFELRRRMYAYISLLAFFLLMTMIDLFFMTVFNIFLLLCIVCLQIALHFLEFVRLGVKNLDDYELRASSISAAIKCEGASNMELIEPIRLSELEPETDSKWKKKWWGITKYT